MGHSSQRGRAASNCDGAWFAVPRSAVEMNQRVGPGCHYLFHIFRLVAVVAPAGKSFRREAVLLGVPFRQLTKARPATGQNPDGGKELAEKVVNLGTNESVYRVPTEAVWEYSCRGGRPSSKPFGVGDGESLYYREANFDAEHPHLGPDKGPTVDETCKVGSYKPNALGLYDMHGNVCEWCSDWYGTYPHGEATNPKGASEGSGRVMRGGGWGPAAGGKRSASRDKLDPPLWGDVLGFRLAHSVPPDGK